MPVWKKRLPPYVLPNRHLLSWLKEPHSLTARCEHGCIRFQVRLLGLRKEPSVFTNPARMVMTREVLLVCDGQPVIFAHTELPTRPRGRLIAWLLRLGSRSLGSLLFSHPGFRRGEIEFCRLDARSSLFHRAVAAAGLQDCRELWARRSAHRLEGQNVLVTEVFLAAILRLEN